jgi:hypothetical protein
MQLRRGTIAAFFLALAWFSPSAQVQAAFHLWQINEVFTNPSGSVQFIELFDPAPGENTIAPFFVTSNANSFDIPSNLVGNTANMTFLLATAGFGALPGGVTPDFVIPPNFFSLAGDTITFTGSGDTLTFTGAQLPKNGVLSLNQNLTTGANSPKNFLNQEGSVVVPEPSTMVLVGLAGSLLMMYRARRRR